VGRVIIALLFAIAIAVTAQTPQQTRTASVSGIVVSMGSNEPIPKASVELRRLDCNSFANAPEVLTAQTGDDGRFNFRDVRAGNWCIVATSSTGKFTPAEYLQRGVLGRGVTLPIADGQSVTGIQLAMAPTGGITGRVLDREGEPMAFARVQVLESFYGEGQRRLYILQVAQTDDRGEYRFYWLPPGQYFVAAVPEDRQRRQVVSVQPPPGTGGRREETAPSVIIPRIRPDGAVLEETYLTVYYPAETNWRNALAVNVPPGVTTSGIDISLRAGIVPSYHIRGAVVNGLTGQPAAGAQIRLAPCEWTSTVVMPSAVADTAGRFDIAGATPGCHVLYANASTPNPAAPPQPAATPGAAPQTPPIQIGARLPLDVSGADLSDIRMVLGPGATVPGKLLVETALPEGIPRGITVSIAREPDLVGLPAGQSRGAVQTDGAFNLPNVGPGDYRVYVAPFLAPFQWGTPAIPQSLQSMYLKSVRLGGTDLLTEGLRIDGGATGEIQIVLGAGGRLAGSTVDEKHQPQPNITVALVPDLGLRHRRELYRSTSSDISGQFRIQGIAPGNYRVFAWEAVERDIWMNPDFIRAIEDRGVPVVIREGEEAGAEVVSIAPTRR
jgi:5-hydroxyisourate hydrolase-like protein (transthyretin family)